MGPENHLTGRAQTIEVGVILAHRQQIPPYAVVFPRFSGDLEQVGVRLLPCKGHRLEGTAHDIARLQKVPPEIGMEAHGESLLRRVDLERGRQAQRSRYRLISGS